MEVSIHSVETEFDLQPREEDSIKQWISSAIKKESQIKEGEITLIFCSDEYLLKMNREYLDHDYYTDIITFPYSENPLTADLFISVDRVKDNASQHGIDFQEELRRVIIHGILHLCGYDDNSPALQKKMREAEDKYLNVWEKINRSE